MLCAYEGFSCCQSNITQSSFYYSKGQKWAIQKKLLLSKGESYAFTVGLN